MKSGTLLTEDLNNMKALIDLEDKKLAVFAAPVAGKIGSPCNKADAESERPKCEGDDTCCAAGVPPACPMSQRVNDMWELTYKPRIEVCTKIVDS